MSNAVADDIIRAGYERWLRLEEEKATIGDDLNMQVPARQVATLDAFDPDDRRPNVSPFHAQPSLLSLLPLL